MLKYDKLPNDELIILFKGIIDRGGHIPKRDLKWIDNRFIQTFLEYTLTCPYQVRIEDAVCQLIRDYGRPFTVGPTNITSIGAVIKVLRYVKLKRVPSFSWENLETCYIANQSSNLKHETEESELKGLDFRFFQKVFLSLVMSDNDLNQKELFQTFWKNAQKYHIRKEPADRATEDISLITKVFYSLIERLTVDPDFDYTYGVRAATLFIDVIDSMPIKLPNYRLLGYAKDIFAHLLYSGPSRKTIFNNIAPVLPKYINPFSVNDYISQAIYNNMEVEDGVIDDYLNAMPQDERMEEIGRLVSMNGNNIKLCKTPEEMSYCMKRINWNDEKCTVTKYPILTKIFSRGLSNTEKIQFLEMGDLSTVDDNSIRKLLDTPDKIMYVAGRRDAAVQYANILNLPSGLLYLITDALPYLSYPASTREFLKGYMLFLEDDKYEKPAMTTLVYMASTIMSSIRIETILTVYPLALKYLPSKPTILAKAETMEIPWSTIAQSCSSAIDLTVTNVYDNIIRNSSYIPMNFQTNIFSNTYYGIEDILDKENITEELIGVCEKGSYGYFFDIVNEDIREVLLTFLAKRAK